jgi:hypothetical protein
MATIELSNEFIRQAQISAVVTHRSLATQIEHWAKLGKIAEENPDLPMSFIKDILISQQEIEAGHVSEYKFE